MFEDIKQHVFCDQKVSKLVIRIFANATINQKSMVTYTFSIWVAPPCLANAMKFVYCSIALKLTLHSSSGLSSLNI